MLNLQKEVKDFYGIQVDSARSIPFGYTNRNFFLSSGSRGYVCRISPSSKIAHLKLESAVLKQLRLRKLGFKIPVKIETKDKESYAIMEEEKYVMTLFEEIPGDNASITFGRPDGREFCTGFARRVGSLHRALRRIEADVGQYTHEGLVRSYAHSFERYATSPVKSEWQTLFNLEFGLLTEELEKYLGYFHENSAKKGIIHTDLRLENVIVAGDRVVGIVDFDDIVAGQEPYDIAKVIVEVFGNKDSRSDNVKHLIDLDGVKRFYRAYIESRSCDRIRFADEVVDMTTLPAIHVMSLVGRDVDFDDRKRAKNVKWYSNFIRALKQERNLNILRTELMAS